MYQEGGVNALKKLGWKGAKNALAEHQKPLEEYFQQHPPVSLKEACAKIKELTGIERGKVAVRDFLLSLGMSFRKSFVPEVISFEFVTAMVQKYMVFHYFIKC